MARIHDSATEPGVEIVQDVLLKFWSVQAGVRGVSNDAQWATAMNQIFSAAAWPGVDPTSLAFLKQFFIQIAHISPPPSP